LRRSSTDWGILARAAAQHCAKTQAKAMAKVKSTLADAGRQSRDGQQRRLPPAQVGTHNSVQFNELPA